MFLPNCDWLSVKIKGVWAAVWRQFRHEELKDTDTEKSCYADHQRWQQVIFCKSKSSHKSFPCKSKSSHKSFPCKSKSSHKSFGQTSSQVTSHLVQTQVKSQVFLSKYKSSRTLFCPAVIRNQGQASNQSTVSYSQRYRKWSMVFNNFYWCTNMEYHTCIHNEIVGGGDLFILFFKFCWQPSSKNTGDV